MVPAPRDAHIYVRENEVFNQDLISAANHMERIYGKTPQQLSVLSAELGLQRFAAGQIARWLYAKDATSFDQMSDLPKDARRVLSNRYRIGVVHPVREQHSSDGTKKYLFPTGGGNCVESAFIPDRTRGTLCLSTQVGCRRACRFCATGAQGLQADLDAGEILDQFRSLPERERVTNIVYMGMGEPLDNLDNVLASLDILSSEYGYGMGAGRITVSTVGILPELETFIAASRVNLAVSLHSPFSEERASLMPVERTHPLVDVLRTIRSAHIGRPRRVSFEYVLLSGVNDSPRHARELVRILDGIRCRINLIPFNETGGSTRSGVRGSPGEVILAFQKILRDKGLVATIRQSKGRDIEAACGLLSTKGLKPPVPPR